VLFSVSIYRHTSIRLAAFSASPRISRLEGFQVTVDEINAQAKPEAAIARVAVDDNRPSK